MRKFRIDDRVKANENYYMHFDEPNRTLWGDCVVVQLYSDDCIDVENQEGVLGSFFPEELDLIEENSQMNVPFTISGDTITVFLDGTTHFLYASDKNFLELKDHLKGTHDQGVISRLVDKTAHVISVTEGLVQITGQQVFYAGGLVHNSLAQKLVDLIDEGFDPKPWARFMDNLMLNPSYKSRESLHTFLERWNAPITEDGCFIAFKNVRSDFMDIHSNTMDNSPGNIVEMPRSQVNDDSNTHCSAGLHACATRYLSSFYITGGKTVSVKIDPRYVVSVPTDYDFAKMRVCRYTVLSEVSKEQIEDIESKGVYFEKDYYNYLFDNAFV